MLRADPENGLAPGSSYGVPDPERSLHIDTSSKTRAVRRASTHGPVADPERLVPAEWWRTLFNAHYLKTDGDVVENAENTAWEVDLLVRAAGLTADDRVLDLCCGQGRHSLELSRRGFHRVSGVDQSRFLINLARRRARRSDRNVAFHVGDSREPLFPTGSFDCVALMGNSFGYFASEDDDVSVLLAARHSLGDGGRVALDLTDGDWMRRNFAPRSWEWIGRHRFVCRERSLSADGDRLICREVITDARRGVLVDQFYAERLYSHARILSLFARAGFGRVEDHGCQFAVSDRDQDLGMMAHRLFFVAHLS
jgi:D-alanine-D-alanine ligase